MSIFEVSFFGLSIAPTWYGLMYALGFLIAYKYIEKYGYIPKKEMDSFLMYIFIGVVIGGRLGYVFFYNFSYFSEHIGEILALWKGGMSFHGGAIGVIIMLVIFAYRRQYRVFDISDVLVSILPLALGLGRIGNYINKELLGYTPYSGPLAIIENGISYFPSPLLQAFLEGILLLSIMQLYRLYENRTIRIPGYASGLFLIGYGLLRIFAEFFRLPDTHIGYLLHTDWLTLGMIYSTPMVVGGIALFYFANIYRK